MKIKSLSLAMLWIFGLSTPATAFDLVSSLTEDLEPVITMEKDDSGVTVNYTFPGAYCYEDDLYPDSFALDIPGFSANMTSGEAAWPIRWDTFEIPLGCEATVELLTIQTSEFQIKLAPARQDLINSSNEVYSFNNVPPINDYNGWLPLTPIKQEDIKIYRDRNILYVGVYPISYNVKERLVRATDHISYRVAFSPSLVAQSLNFYSGIRHNIDEDYMDVLFSCTTSREDTGNETLNVDDSCTKLQSNFLLPKIWTVGDSYLILSRNLYSSAVNKFAEWKRTMGFNVKIEMSDSWTPQTIKSIIQTNYNLDNNLKYLLLFGDELDLPGERHYIFENLPFYTDYFYTCMDGADDDLPDLYSGRISVTNLQEANNVVDKIINYEKLGTSGKNKALLCAQFYDKAGDGYEDNRFTLTSEEIAIGLEALGKSVNRVYLYTCDNPLFKSIPTNWAKGGYGGSKPIPNYLNPSIFNWNGNKEDIKSAINSGVGYVLHRDHGQIQKRKDPEFLINDIKALCNGTDTPIVFSINCLTGMYQYIPAVPNMAFMEYDKPNDLFFGRSTCFSEEFLRQKDGGAVAVFAASHASYNDNNDALIMEMFQLIWPTYQFRTAFPGYVPSKINPSSTPIRRLGELLHASKLRVDQTFNNYGTTQHNNQIYHLFGDPSMEIRESLPKPYKVEVSVESQNSSGVIINVPTQYKLVRVPTSSSGSVKWCIGGKYRFSQLELTGYKYYVIGDDIPPTPLPEAVYTMQLAETIKIEDTYFNGSSLTINYIIPEECNDAILIVKRISDGMSRSIDCINKNNQVTINTNGQSSGIYLIELWSEGKIKDTRKIMLQ